MKGRRLIGLIAGAVMTIVVGGLMAASPAQAADQIVKLVSAQNGKCLQPAGRSLSTGVEIVQMTCDGSTAQQWTVHPVSSTKVHLINRNSGLCMDAFGGATNGTPIIQWECNTISNENWGFGINNNQINSFVAGTASHCIATPGNIDGNQMELRFCDGNISQIWLRPNG